MVWLILFVFGLMIGSFLNVVALRYDGEHFVLDPKEIGGRSHCPHCRKQLAWYELIPVASFLIQGGKCRNCKKRIGAWYPLVELLSGLIFLLVPFRLSLALAAPVAFSAIWIFAFEVLLLVAYIDIRLGIIPDELNIALLVAGFVETWFLAANFGIRNPSFFGPFSVFFGLQANVWVNHFAGAVFGAAFFGALVAVTRGKGMGVGDVKLAAPLGLLFGWPDILMLAAFAFVAGAAFGLVAIALRRKTMGSAVPFAPFLVLGAVFAFFAGSGFFNWYFRLIGF
ncbi:MAG TPA: prepilin peptidase [Candidatus Paceibacterota bacterium]|nr:prepilin peptidase [Candidatus Paceibacterota bacterium]